MERATYYKIKRTDSNAYFERRGIVLEWTTQFHRAASFLTIQHAQRTIQEMDLWDCEIVECYFQPNVKVVA